MSDRVRALVVVVFAAAMAWVESATVVYLRTLIGRIEPYQPNPLPVSVGLGQIEILREAATLVMLLSVGWLAGRTWRSRLGYAMMAFGAWDILYYVFLIPMTGWPRSLFDWDILFLLPLPWWGPVLAPMLIAALMVGYGMLVSQFDSPDHPLWADRSRWVVGTVGATLALYTFVADALRAIPYGPVAIRDVLPRAFDWSFFILSLGLMALPLLDVVMRLWSRRLQGKAGAAAG